MALELGADVVDLHGGSLALQPPGPDLDRIANRLHRCLPGLDALPHELGRAAILDREALDHEPIVERAHDAAGAARHVEWELWLLRGFHRTLEGSRRLRRKADAPAALPRCVVRM